MLARLDGRVLGIARDVFCVLRLLPSVELRRRTMSLHHAVARAREQGSIRRPRSPRNRARLRSIITRIDMRLPGGGNCVRRALLEMAADAGAAHERFFAGFRTGGGSKSGHAWLESNPGVERYDAVIAI